MEYEDMVQHPNHYVLMTTEDMEHLLDMDQPLEAQHIMAHVLDQIPDHTLTPWQIHCVGCMLKYMLRFPNKGKPIQDLEKVGKYFSMLKESLDG